ncbi:actinia tenebrosa protease inhibitors-like isoform X2 [Ornithodoros turicata]|uniref:actinia tenebrosa protease inhibitors-like isoform X2 n=1 Tax=Ornithodoros turicata TaxID=34597 RepID=UPI003139E848
MPVGFKDVCKKNETLELLPRVCTMPPEPGYCEIPRNTSSKRYFYNTQIRSCEDFPYTGCGGNENNFETLQACQERCVIGLPKGKCALSKDAGPCRGIYERYRYDLDAQDCVRFFYTGCGGNDNNFDTFEKCSEECIQVRTPLHVETHVTL